MSKIYKKQTSLKKKKKPDLFRGRQIMYMSQNKKKKKAAIGSKVELSKSTASGAGAH